MIDAAGDPLDMEGAMRNQGDGLVHRPRARVTRVALLVAAANASAAPALAASNLELVAL